MDFHNNRKKCSKIIFTNHISPISASVVKIIEAENQTWSLAALNHLH